MLFFLLILTKTTKEGTDQNNQTSNYNNNHNFTLEDIKNVFQDLISPLKKEIKSDFATLSSKLDYHYNLQKGEYAKNSSYLSTGIIKIDPCSDEGNCFASGNLVIINSSLFFSTCRHVIMVINQLIRKISLIQLYKGPRIEPEGPIYIFQNSSTYYDYALIKVKETDELFSRAAKISNKSATLSETIRGICYRDVNAVYVEGQVVEIEPNQTNVFQSDCGGTHGFSGAGYFDEFGELKVIHKGSGNFLGEDDFSDPNNYSLIHFNKSNTPKLNSIKRAFDKCLSADIFNDDEMNLCYAETSDAINIHARNPRTMVLDATLFYDLISNKTNETLTVYQGNNISNTNNRIQVINTSNQTNNNTTNEINETIIDEIL